jgi:NADH:ubiquinone oxidoreductase subunit K
MIIVAAALGGLGVTCMLYRTTLLGLLIGLQLLVLGATLGFVLAGVTTQSAVEGHIFGIFILATSIGLFAVGLALAVRLFFLRGNTSVTELRNLRS